MRITFNKPYMTGLETEYIRQAVESSKISGNGIFTQRCQKFFQEKYGFRKCLLTTSCTDALEMAAILTDVGPGDEVIVPSYTFVSSALAFVRQGAKIVFCDSCRDNPNIDPAEIEKLVTSRTKVIVPVHYAGVACDMDAIMDIAHRHDLLVVEDAAQAIESFYTGRDGIRRPLGSIGHLAAFSFHETKNIISGEGGMLVVNDPRFIPRAEIIWEKGTNRAEFFRGEVNKYGWGIRAVPSCRLKSFRLSFGRSWRISISSSLGVLTYGTNTAKRFSLAPQAACSRCRIFLDTRRTTPTCSISCSRIWPNAAISSPG